MRNLLALVGLLVVVFAAVGWYCGWYKLSIDRGQDGNVQIQTEVDTKKVADDSTAFFQKVTQMIGEHGQKDNQPGAAPVNTPGPVTTPTPATTAGKDDSQGGWFTSPPKRR